MYNEKILEDLEKESKAREMNAKRGILVSKWKTTILPDFAGEFTDEELTFLTQKKESQEVTQ